MIAAPGLPRGPIRPARTSRWPMRVEPARETKAVRAAMACIVKMCGVLAIGVV